MGLQIEATNKTDLAIRQKSPSPKLGGFLGVFPLNNESRHIDSFAIPVIRYLNGSRKNYTVGKG